MKVNYIKVWKTQPDPLEASSTVVFFNSENL